MSYTPRRQSNRWLDGDCPKEVLAIMDNGGKTFDRYTVFYVPTKEMKEEYPHRGLPVMFRGMSEHPSSPNGFGISDDMPAYEVAGYRYENKRQYATWSSLPKDVKATVRRDCKDIRDNA